MPAGNVLKDRQKSASINISNRFIKKEERTKMKSIIYKHQLWMSADINSNPNKMGINYQNIDKGKISRIPTDSMRLT
jgi:hypothetical protein